MGFHLERMCGYAGWGRDVEIEIEADVLCGSKQGQWLVVNGRQGLLNVMLDCSQQKVGFEGEGISEVKQKHLNYVKRSKLKQWPSGWRQRVVCCFKDISGTCGVVFVSLASRVQNFQLSTAAFGPELF